MCHIFVLKVIYIGREKKRHATQRNDCNTQRVRISTKETKVEEVQYMDTKVKHISIAIQRKGFIQRTRFFRSIGQCVTIGKTVLYYTQFEHRTISMILQRSMAKAFKFILKVYISGTHTHIHTHTHTHDPVSPNTMLHAQEAQCVIYVLIDVITRHSKDHSFKSSYLI